MSNSITAVGNLTRDPEVKYLSSGNASAKFGLAVSRRFQKNGEWTEQTSFFDVVAYGSLAENIGNSLVKGNKVIVTGRLEQRTWETDNGDKRSIIEIVADEAGAALSFATVEVKKNAPKASSRGGF